MRYPEEVTEAKETVAKASQVSFLQRVQDPRVLKWVLVAPLLIILVVLIAFPLFFELYLSFTGWQANTGNWWEAKPVWLANYIELFSERRFLMAVLRTFLVTGAAMFLEGLLGLGLALLLVDNFPGKRFFSSVFLLPMMVIPVVTGFVFFMLFQAAGPLNAILSGLSGHLVRVSWLTSPRTALPAVILADVWQWTPLMFLIFLSGLLAIPPNITDAAIALGASRWQRFIHIILPLLRPVIVIALIIRGVELVKVCDKIFILTKGGPGTSTEVISTYLYEVGFRYFRLALTAAAAFIILVLLTLLAMQAVKPLRIVEVNSEQKK
jgi:multiple sugar transport system permease protein